MASDVKDRVWTGRLAKFDGDLGTWGRHYFKGQWPLKTKLTDSRLANLGASAIFEAFRAYQKQFNTITQRARGRFKDRDWHGLQADATERLSLYRKIIKRNVADIRELLGNRVSEKLVWVSIKAVYSNLIADRDDWELAETFFNSVTRQIFTTVGVDPQVEFVDTDFEIPPTPTRVPVATAYRQMQNTRELVETILSDFQFSAPFKDLSGNIELVAGRIEAQLRAMAALRVVERTEIW